LLHGYLDRELDLLESLEVERHLCECPGCAQSLAAGRSLRAALQAGSAPAEPAPEFRQRLRAALRRASAGNRRVGPRIWRRLAVAAALLLAAGSLAVSFWLSYAAQPRLADEVVTNHLRSLLNENRLVDIASSDRHVVKPWFAGKTNFTFPIPDLADRGLSLVGGRLDYLDHRIVAVLIYKRKDHVISIFIWPAGTSTDMPEQFSTHQGFQLAHWQQGEMIYWAVSDLEAEQFQQLVRSFRNP
jgi:anti-sigma factor RsiW